jgi:hypothetical protein
VAIRLPGEHKPIVKSYRTFWRALQKMAADLVELGVTDVAMESTGVFWWPVYHALAATGRIEVCVANAEHLKSVPGRKSDIVTASGSLSCTLSGSCARVSFPPRTWQRCDTAPATARS